MIHFEKFTLPNGLRVIVHEDHTTPMVVVNTLYDVGARDEHPEKTGFAHLFEHLMFGGSAHAESFDEPLQKAGGSSNAFTSNDLTNYYDILPAANIETALWLESDRMLSLSFKQEVLDVQKKVVIEEFKQRYLNQPYGDVWLHLRPLAYKVHPYRWNTIGKDISHIERATMDDVKDFFFRFYRPQQAILVIAGDIKASHARQLVEKWYGDIPAGEPYHRQLPQEPPQTQARFQEVKAAVPLSAIYKAYHMVGRTHPDYYATDILSNALGAGESSRLHKALVQEQRLFHEIYAYIMGHLDPGLLVIQGKLNEGVSIEAANRAIEQVVEQLLQEGVQARELEKVKNQAATDWAMGNVELMNRALHLAYFELLGDAANIEHELERIRAVSLGDINRVAAEVLNPNNCSTLFYIAEPGSEAK
ncbi:M16 family metallopeptidase [Thermonema rossianum]|uniref:M16 family metallopeptidase n=1 Tax=Thermonema rossianum TaxID=55505 RepID=UPI00056F2A9B|nr:pitrilysin family protein [Thermonema rossianum]